MCKEGGVGECERKGVQERGKLEEVVKGVAHTVILTKSIVYTNSLRQYSVIYIFSSPMPLRKDLSSSPYCTASLSSKSAISSSKESPSVKFKLLLFLA
jgi:hypothetical protein